MGDHAELEAALIDFTRLLLADSDVNDVLLSLTQRLTAALHLTGAGASLAGDDGMLRAGPATCDLTLAIGAVEGEIQEGPSRDAFDTGTLVYATGDELTTAWPRLGPVLVDAGIWGAAAVPMRQSHEQVGAVAFYWGEPHHLTDDDLALASVLADAATAYVIHARRDALARRAHAAELERAGQELAAGHETARRAKETQREMMSRVSHELRTPLNAIIGFAQLMELSGRLSEEDRESVGHILRDGRRLLAMIEDLLDLGRIERGVLELRPEDVPVGTVVAEAAELVQPLAAAHGVALHADAVDPTVAVRADRNRLGQVLRNLLSNAVKYNRPQGEVHIGVVVGSTVRIAVADTGPGVPPEQIDKLFVPFHRLGAERTDIEGTGVGLTVTLGLLRSMDSDLHVDSEPDRGSTFWFELPAVRVPGRTGASLSPSRS